MKGSWISTRTGTWVFEKITTFVSCQNLWDELQDVTFHWAVSDDAALPEYENRLQLARKIEKVGRQLIWLKAIYSDRLCLFEGIHNYKRLLLKIQGSTKVKSLPYENQYEIKEHIYPKLTTLITQATQAAKQCFLPATE